MEPLGSLVSFSHGLKFRPVLKTAIFSHVPATDALWRLEMTFDGFLIGAFTPCTLRIAFVKLVPLTPVSSAVSPSFGASLTLRFALFPPGGRPGLSLLRACLLAVLAVGLAFVLSLTTLHANLPMTRADGNAVKAHFPVTGAAAAVVSDCGGIGDGDGLCWWCSAGDCSAGCYCGVPIVDPASPAILAPMLRWLCFCVW